MIASNFELEAKSDIILKSFTKKKGTKSDEDIFIFRRITRDDHRMRQARRITEVRVSIPKSEAKEQKSVIASNSLQELDETSF